MEAVPSSRAKEKSKFRVRVRFQELTSRQLNYASNTGYNPRKTYNEIPIFLGWWASTPLPKLILSAIKCSTITSMRHFSVISRDFLKNLWGTPTTRLQGRCILHFWSIIFVRCVFSHYSPYATDLRLSGWENNFVCTCIYIPKERHKSKKKYCNQVENAQIWQNVLNATAILVFSGKGRSTS